MPEGPELRFLKEQFKKIKGKTVTKITSYSKNKVNLPSKSKIINIHVKGKLLYIQTDNYYIHIHLMLTGWLYKTKPDYTKYIIHLDKGNIYVDSMRKFTKVEIMNKRDHTKKINKLGVDILTKDFTLKKFTTLIRSKKMMISKFLMDQDKLAGIGNYIKNEALYIARIHPKMNTSVFADKKIKALYQAIRYVSFSVLLDHLKDSDISIPKDIANIKPNKVTIPYYYKVYSQKIDHMGNKVTKEKIAGRDAYYVKKYQKN